MSPRWTDEQLEAITSTRHTLLAASAGTGKTTTVVGKILWSLGLDVGRGQNGGDVAPCPDPITMDEVAAITFTEKAAHDLKDKLRTAIEAVDPEGRLRWDLERATVGTIHGFASELLREHALRLGIDPNFRILDPLETEVQQGEIVREVLASALRDQDEGAVALTRRYGLAGWKVSPGAVQRVLGVMRDLRWRARQFDAWSVPIDEGPYTRRLDRDGLRERARFAGAWSDEPVMAGHDEASLELADALYRLGRASVGSWLSWLERENARDFDSLILDAKRLLTRPETAAAKEAIRRRFKLLVIDEFQDTDSAQWEIARALTRIGEEEPAAGPQLFLVGDPKQSIYRFRGADIDVWNQARAQLEQDGRSLELSWNFRSDPRLVEFVNRVGRRALDETAAALEESQPNSVVRYQPLRSARPASASTGLEWVAVEASGTADERRAEEARRVSSRIRQLIEQMVVVDPDDGSSRPCRAGDVAILARRNDDLAALESALRIYDLPFYNTATRGLAEQQEILDLATALRLIDNRFDDLRAFAFLRSPFVGLRDEVLVRIGLTEPDRAGPRTGPRSFLEKAETFLEGFLAGEDDWFAAPERPEIDDIERTALANGLTALREAHELVDRVDHAEVLETLLSRTSYRLHLLIREGAAESLANIERFLALLDEYRHLTLGRFLRLWERWGEKDLGIPQARLFSSGDDVVTLSTIHAAKGLEWPVVVLVGTDAPLAGPGRLVGTHWTDPVLGPVLLPKKDERGPRCKLAMHRRLEQETAEEARLLYVATTRARDRLVISAPAEKTERGFAAWFVGELDRARELHETAEGAEDGTGENGGRPVPLAVDDDQRTGTGGQLDAFGFDRAAAGQLDLFGAPKRDDDSGTHDGFVIIRRGGGSVQTAFRRPPVRLDWLGDVVPSPWPESARDIAPATRRSLGSATERMLKSRDEAAWRLRYLHGVLEPADYLPDGGVGGALPAKTRGTLIHGVLERIRAAEELGRVLEETIASLDLAELESALVPGSSYREALEREITNVVRSPQWRWYVEGEHHRELRFLHHSADGWLQGAFDLYRPGGRRAHQVSLFDAPDETGDVAAWVIDFKTHLAEVSEVATIAEEYAIQTAAYREAAAALGSPGGRPRVGLHFTHPNVVIEV